MIDRNGKRIRDGDYVTTPVCDGIVVGKNPATALVKVMNVDTGAETWVYPNHCAVVDDIEIPNHESY